MVTTAVLTEPDDEVAALLSHELVHWRTGDEITSAFVRGVGLPLTLAHALPTWLMRTFPHPATNFVVFVFFWPVLLTMRYVVLPLHARDVRAAEYRADLGAVLTGHVDGLRSVLERRLSFGVAAAAGTRRSAPPTRRTNSGSTRWSGRRWPVCPPGRMSPSPSSTCSAPPGRSAPAAPGCWSAPSRWRRASAPAGSAWCSGRSSAPRRRSTGISPPSPTGTARPRSAS
ncbi:M48 family metalloprotease [Micromonospora sp. M12]